MKALKNDSSLYVEQIVSAITACYENNDKPSNRSLMELYTLIGRFICRQGEKAFVAHLAEMLTSRFPSLKGFSLRNLRRMRDFYRTYANNPALMEKAQSLGWTQNAVILECCETQEQRSFYIDLAAGQNLSKLALIKAIQENAFDTLFNKESPAENGEPSFASASDNSLNVAVDTAASIETACEPFVPACEPLRQGDTVPRSADRVSTAVSAEVSIGRQTKRKFDGEPPPLGFIKLHQPYPPPLVLWTDKLKPPQKPLPGTLRPQKKYILPYGRMQYEIQQRVPFPEQTVA
jgi:predicted nuclease of restriction endonuclease-like (RecB) superfamily